MLILNLLLFLLLLLLLPLPPPLPLALPAETKYTPPYKHDSALIGSAIVFAWNEGATLHPEREIDALMLMRAVIMQ